MTLHSPILTLRLSRSITFFIASLIAYVWRMHLTVADFMPLTPQQALAPRISISAILGLGLLCLVLVIRTLARLAWRQKRESMSLDVAGGLEEQAVHDEGPVAV